MNESEAPTCCPSCGGAIIPAAELRRAAWEVYLFPSKNGPDPRETLAMIAIQLSHRLGECAEKRVCPGSFGHIGTRLIRGRVPRCGVCANEVDVDKDGFVAGHLVGPRLTMTEPRGPAYPVRKQRRQGKRRQTARV
jgi:hypothetical protein